MESAHYLQQMPCSISRHTLIMLLHYLGKLKRFKFAANIEQTANKMHRFLQAHILMDLTYLFIAYLLRQFMVPVKYSLK